MSEELKAEDIEVSVYKKPGHGWSGAVQCCDITHKPTGIKVTSEGERSEHKSRMVAMDMLRERLDAHPSPPDIDKEITMSGEFTEGVCEDGAAILKDGVRMTVSEILAELNTRPQPDSQMIGTTVCSYCCRDPKKGESHSPGCPGDSLWEGQQSQPDSQPDAAQEEIMLGSGGKIVTDIHNHKEGWSGFCISEHEGASVGETIETGATLDTELNPIIRIISTSPESLDVIIAACERAKEHFDIEQPSAGGFELETYDAGSLNDFGGGDVDWWWDYIRSELDRAHDFYQSQAGQQGWVSVEDRLPEERKPNGDQNEVLLLWDNNVEPVQVLGAYVKNGFFSGEDYLESVTHWMPLPAPPK